MNIPATLSLTPAETRIIGLALAVKIMMAAFMLFVFHQFSDFEQVYNLGNRWYTGQENRTAWYLPFANWDGQHYLILSDLGYKHWAFSQGFYPLYPMLMRVLSPVFPPWVSGLILSYLFTAAFCVFFYRIAAHLECPKPHLAVLMLLAFPSAFFTGAIYTEALFLLLLTGFLYHLLVTRSYAILMYAFLMPLTRGAAAFVAGGLLLHTAFEYARARSRAKKQEKAPAKSAKIERAGANRRRKRKARAAQIAPGKPFDWRYPALCLAAFLAGVLAYLLFMKLATGDASSGFAAQDMFPSQHSASHLFNPAVFFSHLIADIRLFRDLFAGLVNLHGYHHLPDHGVVLFFLAALIFVIRREWALLCFYLPLVYAHASVSAVRAGAYLRFMLIAAPFLVLAWLKAAPPPSAAYALCAAFFAAQLYFAYRFSLNLWAG